MLQLKTAVAMLKFNVLMFGTNLISMWSEFVLKHSETKEATHFLCQEHDSFDQLSPITHQHQNLIFSTLSRAPVSLWDPLEVR